MQMHLSASEHCNAFLIFVSLRAAIPGYSNVFHSWIFLCFLSENWSKPLRAPRTLEEVVFLLAVCWTLVKFSGDPEFGKTVVLD